jgi:hypothetical protein
MGEDILAADEEGMKSMLTMLYDNKPNFPIESDVDIINIFGGPLGSIQLNKDEKITSTKLSQRAMAKADKFKNAQELLDAIVGHNYYNVVMKTTILFDINKNDYPITSEHEMEDIIHGCLVAGIDKDELLKKIEFPIEKPDIIVSVLESMEPEVCGPDIPILEIQMPQPTIKTAEVAEAKPAEVESAKVEVEFGESFLVEHDKPDYLFKALGNIMKVSGVKLLCISRSNPKQLRSKYELKGELLWLTENISATEKAITPSLESIAFTIEEAIRTERETLILLDGLEYLVSSNTFGPVVKFVRRMVDMVSEAKVALIVPVSPSAIGNQDLKNLEREMTPVDENSTLSLNEEKFKQIFTDEEIEHAFDVDDSLELDEELGLDEDGSKKPRDKKEVMSSIAKSMDKIRSISSKLREESDGPAKDASQDTPKDKEQRQNIKNQVREWKQEGFEINALEALLEDDIQLLNKAFTETMEKVQAARVLIERLSKLGLSDSDPRYTYLKGKLNYPLLSDETEKELDELEEELKSG